MNITELADLFPTLCDLPDIGKPDYMQGVSFVPLIHIPKQNWKIAAFCQFDRRPKVYADGKSYIANL